MPLRNFFTAQFELVRLFMIDPNQTVRVVKCDPDLRPLLMKALGGLDNEADNPNVMLCAEVPFDTPGQFYDGLTADLAAAYEQWKPQLAEVGYEPQYVESGAPGRGNVFARLAGADSSRGALLIHGHLDVVPAEPAEWSVHPFSGAVELIRLRLRRRARPAADRAGSRR